MLCSDSLKKAAPTKAALEMIKFGEEGGGAHLLLELVE